MQATGRPKVTVSADGRGVVGHAGARLLADVADVTGLTDQLGQALAGLRQWRGGHDPGRIAVDLAVMIADGGEAIADLAVLRDQAQLFGEVASDPTAWRLLSALDDDALVQLRVARAAARRLAWAQMCESRDGLPASTAAGQPVPGLVFDLDASIVICHSDKEQASKTWKKTFGFHPLFCFLDNTREALSGLLRAGRAGSNTTADHITVLDQALAQIPDEHRYGTDILIGENTAALVEKSFLLREIDMVRVVGREQPVRIYELRAAAATSLPHEQQKAFSAYAAGLEAYRDQHWDDALGFFQESLSLWRGDIPSQTMLARCQFYREVPPPKEWDGVFEALHK